VAWYRDRIFPACYDFLTSLGGFDRCRPELLAAARGEVLEIGIGTGRNLPFYPPEIERVTGLEPNPGMRRQLERRGRRERVAVEALAAGADAVPREDAAFDTVVSTLVLCSVPRRERVLAEVRRLLRPGGRLLLLEHGLSPDPGVARWQRRLNPLQRRFASGCLLDVPVRRELEAAGFDCGGLSEGYLEGESRTHGYIYRGIAHPR